jgi:antirestriction protein ArdC
MSKVLSHELTTFAQITMKIIEAIKSGPGAFRMPWHSPGGMTAFPINAATEAPYRGINVLSLWIDAIHRNFATGAWASYKQWQSLGAQVRKGERGSLIVFYKRLETEDEDEEQRSVFTSSHVFNAAQVDGWQPANVSERSEVQIDDAIEAFVLATGARVDRGFAAARYRHDMDLIEMPRPSFFIGTTTSTPTQSYYGVLLHELTHWSGASHRLNRELGTRFGDEAYAMEELVAELGAAFLCSAFGIANEPRPDHAQYLAGWIKVLEADPGAIFTAASRAQEATQYLIQLAEDNRPRRC